MRVKVYSYPGIPALYFFERNIHVTVKRGKFQTAQYGFYMIRQVGMYFNSQTKPGANGVGLLCSCASVCLKSSFVTTLNDFARL